MLTSLLMATIQSTTVFLQSLPQHLLVSLFILYRLTLDQMKPRLPATCMTFGHVTNLLLLEFSIQTGSVNMLLTGLL